MTLHEAVVRLACCGMTHVAIAERIGVSEGRVKSLLYRLRASGLCPPVHRARLGLEDPEYWVGKLKAAPKGTIVSRGTTPRARGSEKRVHMGNMGLLVSALGQDLMKRIAKEVPPGSTLAEMLAAIIKDYYAELEEKK